MAKNNFKIAELLGRLPDPDERGLLSRIDKQQVDQVVATLHQGGRKTIKEIVDLCNEEGNGDDMKARYALHCLALAACDFPEQQRAAFAQSLASQLDSRHKAVQGYLIRQLQVVGGLEVVETLGKLLVDEDLCEYAAQALVAINNGAAEQFRRALPKSIPQCRPTIVQNLGVLGDKDAVKLLKQSLSDRDREVRLAARWALANIGEDTAAQLLIKAAKSTTGHEQSKTVQACLLLAENLAAQGKSSHAKNIYTALSDLADSPHEAHIIEAARRGLAATGTAKN